MEIKSTLTSKAGKVFETTYIENQDPYADLGTKKFQGIHAFCFCGGKLVLVLHNKSGWVPPGGHIEKNERYEDTVVREVKEETNMKVLHQELIGFLDVAETDRTVRQTRSFCIVEPYGDFVADEDAEGDISEIKLIDPKDYKQYFDWGEIGDRIMHRAMELYQKYEAGTK